MNDLHAPIDSATIFYDALLRNPVLKAPSHENMRLAVCLSLIFCEHYCILIACIQVLAFFIEHTGQGGHLVLSSAEVLKIINTSDPLSIPIWTGKKVPPACLLPVSKAGPKNDLILVKFLNSSATLSPAHWRRLVQDVGQLLATLYGVRPTKRKQPEAHSERQLTTAEEGIVQSIIDAAPPQMTHLVRQSPILIDSALASVILFLREPAAKMFVGGLYTPAVRTAFQALMNCFTQQRNEFTFPDGINSPPISRQLSLLDLAHLQEAHSVLNARVHDMAAIRWHEVVGRDGKPLAELPGRILNMLAVRHCWLRSH